MNYVQSIVPCECGAEFVVDGEAFPHDRTGYESVTCKQCGKELPVHTFVYRVMEVPRGSVLGGASLTGPLTREEVEERRKSHEKDGITVVAFPVDASGAALR